MMPRRTRLRTPLAVLGAVSVAFGLAVVGGVGVEDAALAEKVSTNLPRSAAVRASGDIIAVSADGQSLERMCGFRRLAHEPQPFARVYVNAFAANLPVAIRSELELRGWIDELSGEERTEFDEDCQCRLVDRVNLRQSLCMVEKVMLLSEEGGKRPVAARARLRPVELFEPAFDACDKEFSAAAQAQARVCPIEAQPRWSAQLRDRLDLIQVRIEQEAPARSTSHR